MSTEEHPAGIESSESTSVRGPLHVYLTLTVSTFHTGGHAWTSPRITDSYTTGTFALTSCGIRGHMSAQPSKRHRDGGYSHLWLDCPCDVTCPRCGAPVGRGCTTLDGGGTSGGGFPTSAHAVRVKSSPRCQALLEGRRAPCDLGDHDWQPDVAAEHRPGNAAGFDATTTPDDEMDNHIRAWQDAEQATCTRCERTDKIGTYADRPRIGTARPVG